MPRGDAVTIIVAVVTHEDGQGYVVRAELIPGAPAVVWRVASGLCEGREFVAVPSSDGDAVDDLREALGADWRVHWAGEVPDGVQIGLTP